MKLDQDLTTIRDDVFLKIGRNLLNFQKIERMLKHIIVCSRATGKASELKQNLEARKSATQKKTMGNLVGDLLDNTFQLPDKPLRSSEELEEACYSLSFYIETDAGFYESKKQALQSLVNNRNDFIHHLLPRFNPESLESCLEIDKYLDQQRERLIPEYEYLKSLFDSIGEYLDYLNSEEGRKQLVLSILQQNPLIELLINVSLKKARPDGWALLSKAGDEVRKILPEEMENLESKWGYEKLKDVVLASELFELFEEPTGEKGRRLLYRLKEQNELPSND